MRACVCACAYACASACACVLVSAACVSVCVCVCVRVRFVFVMSPLAEFAAHDSRHEALARVLHRHLLIASKWAEVRACHRRSV